MERKTPVKDSKESFPNPMSKVPLSKRPLKVNMQEMSETSSLSDVDLLKKIIEEHSSFEENVNNENIPESETSLFSCKASLYQFLDEVWRLVERIVGVFILSNQTNTRYRIVGFNSDKKFGSDTFVKWRDGKYIYGLSFQNEPTSKTFSKAVLDSAYKLSQITTYKRRKSLIESSKIDYSSTDSVNILLEPENNLNSREKVVKEIFTSEKDYLHKLTQLIEECYNPTVNGKYKNVFTKEERKAIYGNVEIMKGINTNLLRDLEKKLGRWSPIQTIGDTFLQMIPFFKVYKEYYTGYEAGIELLEKLSKKKDVAAYLKHCETVADGHKLPYLLIMPVQRIPRYSLLLNELIKQTDPSHPDYSDLITAKDDLKEFTMNVNESVRGQEHYRKFSEQVQDPKKYIGFDAILAPHRNLIFESEVEVNMGDRVYTWTLLFTDLLVFASTSGKKKTVEEKLSIEQIWFEDLADLGCETKFRIVTPSSMYLVDVKSVLEKQKWLSIADKTISSWLTNRITFDGQTRKFGYIFPNNGRYDGEWLYAKPHGQGTFIYPNGNLYVGSFESGKRSGSGKLIYNNNGGVYEGYWASNRPDGYGRLALRTGTYEGNFQNGYKSGAGKMTWANGDVYDGHWADDCMHSNGTLITSSFTYIGEWEKNMFHGKGVLTFPGGKYEGQWVHDRKEGEGVFVDSVGDIYTGSWKDDAYHGHGVFTKSTGNYKYEGDWEANKRNGNGTLIVPDNTYKGAWKDDRSNKRGEKCNGFGVITYRDGTTYEGYWNDGRKEGVGLWKTADNEVYEGQWVNDKKHGRGKYAFRDGSNYEGEWVNDRKEGKGVFTWPNGMKYSGTWLADKRHGKGVLSSHDESFKYAGEWVNGYRHGKGILTDQLGTYEGEWVDDKRHGAGKFVSVDGITLEGTWNNNLIDGDANYTKKDVTLQVFFKESHLEKPDYEILAPLLPPLKTLKL